MSESETERDENCEDQWEYGNDGVPFVEIRLVPSERRSDLAPALQIRDRHDVDVEEAREGKNAGEWDRKLDVRQRPRHRRDDLVGGDHDFELREHRATPLVACTLVASLGSSVGGHVGDFASACHCWFVHRASDGVYVAQCRTPEP